MIEPCGYRVLVKLLKPEDVDGVFKSTSASGIIIPKTQEAERREQSIDMAYVISLGPTAYKDHGGEPWCAKGDIVAFAKYGGKTVKDLDTDEQYQVLNDDDIVAVIKRGAYNE